MIDRYAVIGNPVAHSKSPEIQAAFARSLGHALTYERLMAPLDSFPATVDAFRQSGGRGANVTLPFKQEAFAYATEHTARAERGGAVNTLKFEGARVIGDNTDGAGLVGDIERNLAFPIRGRRVLLLGAGGAARGVAGALLATGPAVLVIANRTSSKAEEIAALFSDHTSLHAASLSDLPGDVFDLIINATSASLNDQLPPVPVSCFSSGSLAYDMMYGKQQTPFLALAAGAGARTSDGLGMLVEQAAEAFLVWRGVRPDTGPVMAMLRAA